MTVFELFDSLGMSNIYEVMYAKNMTVREAELDGAFSVTRYVNSFCTEYECHKVVNWKIVCIIGNKIYLALTIEY